MQSGEWIDMLRVLPVEQHNTIVLVLKNRAEIAVDTLYRFDTNFLVLRGRVGGTTDEGRAFFIPYDQMVYYRIERVVKLEELQSFFDAQPERALATPSDPVAPAQPQAPAAPTAQPPDANSTRNALLDRIRAARATPSISGIRPPS